MDYQTLMQAVDVVNKRKDSSSNNHGQRVADLAFKCALLYDPAISHDLRMMIYFGAGLHDQGKVFLDDSILNKSRRLTTGEYEHIKSHVTMGYNLAKDLGLHPVVCDIILYHHERVDGTGYLKGKRAIELPWYVRMATVLDCFDAMISDRPYRKAFTVKQTIKELELGIDKQYDGKFVDILKSLPEISKENF